MNRVKTAVIGLGCRGSLLASIVADMEEAVIVRVCDLYEDRQAEAASMIEKKSGHRPGTCTDYHELLCDPEVEAVIIAASWEAHVPIAVDCMRAGKITALEVGGAYSVDDCRRLVETYEQTRTPFMFLENCCYGKFELLSTALARKGLLGEIVHCHGAYGHDLRAEVLGGNVNRHYRLNNYLKRNCENYPTHELGPIARLLGINRGNRMSSVTAMASKAAGMRDYIDREGEALGLSDEVRHAAFRQGDIVKTCITCAGGETIVLTLDTTLPRFYCRDFTVVGTRGRYSQMTNSVILDGVHHEVPGEMYESYAAVINNGAEYEKQYQSALWQEVTPEMLPDVPLPCSWRIIAAKT